MNKLMDNFIKLIRCSILSNSNEDFFCTGEEAKKLYELCEFHKITELTYSALLKFADSSLAEKMQKNHNLYQYKFAMQQDAYNEIKEELYNKKIKFMPLKGIKISELYPEKSMREMADIDIYVEKESLKKVKELMINFGYDYSHKGHHEVYNKNGFISVEIHEFIMDKQRETGIEAFFENCMDESNDGIKYEMTIEKEYFYLLMHLYGHFRQGGAGVRFVTDIWYFLKKYKTTLNMNYVNEILKNNDLEVFHDNLMNLCDYWFGGGKADKIAEEFGEYIIKSGIYGLTENLVMDLSIGKKNNASYIIKRKLFLSKDEVQKRTKSKILMPFWYLKRIFLVFGNIKEVKIWLKGLMINKRKIAEHKKKMKLFGVNFKIN